MRRSASGGVGRVEARVPFDLVFLVAYACAGFFHQLIGRSGENIGSFLALYGSLPLLLSLTVCMFLFYEEMRDLNLYSSIKSIRQEVDQVGCKLLFNNLLSHLTTAHTSQHRGQRGK